MTARIKSPYDSRENPNLGGTAKPTAPDGAHTRTSELHKPDGQKIRLHAARVWNRVRPKKPVQSKGCAEPSPVGKTLPQAEPISTTVSKGKGYDGSEGYSKVGGPNPKGKITYA